MSQNPAFWSKDIAAETIGGMPFRMYVERPRRIEHLLPFAGHWLDRPYVVQGERVVTFRTLLDHSAAKARHLAQMGIESGDRIMLLGWNGPEWIVNFWGSIRIGAVPVLGNAWWSADEIAHAMDLLEPALTLADARGSARIAAAWRRGAWEMATSQDLDPTEPTVARAAKAGDENAPAAIIFTSGTEGRAKAVVLSHRALIATQQMLLHATRRLPYTPDPAFGEITLHTGPLFHIGGIGALLRGVMLGNTLVFPRGRFDAGEALALIERYKVRRWNAVPTMATRLIEHPDLARRNVSSLTSLTLGGAPVHAELLARIRDALPSIEARIATGYGLSENAGQATAAGGADVIDRPGSSGRPLPLAEIRIVPRPGLPDGEVLVRSPTQMSGYFGSDVSPIDAEGWLSTGDLGRLDERGHLWITGRAKDLIIRGAENIAPAAVERALMELPGVAEAAVLGVPHPELGEEVMAFVVVTGGETAEQIGNALRARIASFAVPSLWQIQTDPLPVNQTGKVDKSALRASLRQPSKPVRA